MGKLLLRRRISEGSPLKGFPADPRRGRMRSDRQSRALCDRGIGALDPPLCPAAPENLRLSRFVKTFSSTWEVPDGR